MSAAEIIAELPRLKPEERTEVFARLCELQEQDLIAGATAGPTEAERKLLDEALAEFEQDGDFGQPWREALREIRTSDQP